MKEVRWQIFGYLGIMLLIVMQVFSISRVEGDSMDPALRSGDLVLIFNNPLQEYKVGDIIVFNAMGKRLVKRISATHEEPTMLFTPPVNHYAVLGDNSGESVDSLIWENPYISRDVVRGKIIRILYRGE